MKKSLGPRTIAYPHPVFLVGSYDAEGQPNLAAVAWGGICCSKPPMVAVSLRAATHTHGSILLNRAFTVCIPDRAHLREADHVGIYSGRDRNKFAHLGLTEVRSDLVDAPYAAEFPLVLECRLAHVHELGLHTQFVGEILDTKADEAALNEKGFPDMGLVDPLAYSTGDSAYYVIGERVGGAFSVGKDQDPS